MVVYRVHLGIMVVLLALLLAAADGAVAQDQGEADLTRLCMVLNIGEVNDGTFNESTYNGLLDLRRDYMLAEEDTVYYESDGPDDWAPNIARCIDAGFGVVITVGFQLGEVTFNAAQANPDRYFIGVDQFVQDGPTNYVGIQFRDDEAGFLMGYMAGLISESGVVGGIFGPPIPVIRRFRNGFENGVRQADADLSGRSIQPLGAYTTDFNQPDEGEALAQRLIDQGADVIFGAAGPTGSAGIRHAAQNRVFVLGVDQDEYFTTFESGAAPGSQYLVSSALKRVDVGVYDMASALLDGDLSRFPGGGNYVLSLANGGISFANPHGADVPPEVFDQVVQVGTALATGESSTGVDVVSGERLPPEDINTARRYAADRVAAMLNARLELVANADGILPPLTIQDITLNPQRALVAFQVEGPALVELSATMGSANTTLTLYDEGADQQVRLPMTDEAVGLEILPELDGRAIKGALLALLRVDISDFELLGIVEAMGTPAYQMRVQADAADVAPLLLGLAQPTNTVTATLTISQETADLLAISFDSPAVTFSLFDIDRPLVLNPLIP